MIENKTFKAINDEGNEVLYETILTFDLKETKKSYVIYTDNTIDEDGKLRLYASTYDPNIKNIELKPIESENEWEIIETIIKTINEDLK